MDWKFWLPLAVNVAGAFFTYRQVQLARRALQRMAAVNDVNQQTSSTAFLKQYWPMFVMMALVLLTWMPYLFLANTVTEGNIEAYVRSWLDHYSITSRRINIPDTIFAFQIDRNEVRIDITRPQNFDQYLVFQSTLVQSAEDRELLSKLTPANREQLARHLRLELSKLNISYTNLSGEINNIRIEGRIPISGLTEYAFLNKLDEVESAVHIVGLIVTDRVHQ